MKSLLCILALYLISYSSNSLADLDTPQLQPKAGQKEMDIAYDITKGDKDLKAAKHYNEAKRGQGYLSIQLNPELKFAQFSLTLPTKSISHSNSEQLKSQTDALTLWSTLFKLQPAQTCSLQRYEAKNLNKPANNAQLAETSLTWSLQCKDLQAITHIEVGLFTKLAPELHTMHIDWLTPTSMGIMKNTLPITIKPYQSKI